MGEIADLVINGHLCQLCGCYIDELPGGYPRSCGDCLEEEERDEL